MLYCLFYFANKFTSEIASYSMVDLVTVLVFTIKLVVSSIKIIFAVLYDNCCSFVSLEDYNVFVTFFVTFVLTH